MTTELSREGGVGGVRGVSETGSVFIVFNQEIVVERWRVTISSTLTMAYGISIAGISLGGGWLIETSGYPALFGGSTLITLLGVLCFHIYFRTPRGEYANSPPV